MIPSLLVADPRGDACGVAADLRDAGYECVVTASGEQVAELVARHRPAAIVLDTDLPDVGGVEVCSRLRSAGDWTPLVLVSDRGDELDRVLGLRLGADDYVVRPYSALELDARVAVLLRRAQLPLRGSVPDGGQVLHNGHVALDVERHRVTVAGREVALSAREFELLAYLLARPGRVVGRAQLLRDVWGVSGRGRQRTVDVHVAQVRAKLGAGGDVIRTVRGVGYGAPAWPPTT